MVFSRFFKQKLTATSLLKGAYEVHCHVLPGVDDGIQTMEHAQEALQHYADLGYQGVVFTPHMMAEWPKNNPSFLKPRLAALQEVAPQGLELKLAGEYMLDEHFLTHLQEGPLLSYDGKHVLVETSYLAPSPIMKEQLYELRLAGYQPILAHPERYVYMGGRGYDQLKEQGVLFQLNLLSLSGAYGSGAKEKAQKLLNKGYYDFVGTDTHRPKWLKNGIARFEDRKSLFKLLAPLFERSRLLGQGDLK